MYDCSAVTMETAREDIIRGPYVVSYTELVFMVLISLKERKGSMLFDSTKAAVCMKYQ